MKANNDFLYRSVQFWGYVRIISQQVGYSQRGTNEVKKPTEKEILLKLEKLDVKIDSDMLLDVMGYIHYRADILNNFVKRQLMDIREAETLFQQLHKIYIQNSYTCKLPLIKQSKDKKIHAYLTGIVNILTESFLREYAMKNGLNYGVDVFFDDDPLSLTYITDNNNYVQGTLSRRFDGAYPKINNPKAIWEIKEYYNTTSFGSRIADGVYETLLDGYEINEISNFISNDIKHFYIIDAYTTWWVGGKSYLCRIIDMLHIGLVDEVIFGKEVFSRWHDVLEELTKE